MCGYGMSKPLWRSFESVQVMLILSSAYLPSSNQQSRLEIENRKFLNFISSRQDAVLGNSRIFFVSGCCLATRLSHKSAVRLLASCVFFHKRYTSLSRLS